MTETDANTKAALTKAERAFRATIADAERLTAADAEQLTAKAYLDYAVALANISKGGGEGMELINLTPHAIHIVTPATEDAPERRLLLPPSGIVARCPETTFRGELVLDRLFTVPIIRKTFGAIQGLPEPRANTFYIVSTLVAQAAWALGRADVFCPGDAVRDNEGKIIGYRCLCRG